MSSARAAALAMALAAAGGLLTAQGVREWPQAPPPTSPPSSSGPQPAAARIVQQRTAPPTRLEIPGIGVRTRLLRLGLDAAGAVEVPPLTGDAPAGWYEHSAAPGDPGSAVLLGHVDTARDGPAVFYRLGSLRRGDPVTVGRADGSTVHFVVSAVARYPKERFPTAEVYGPSDVPVLRLVTCGGRFDRERRSYRDNIVVTALLR